MRVELFVEIVLVAEPNYVVFLVPAADDVTALEAFLEEYFFSLRVFVLVIEHPEYVWVDKIKLCPGVVNTLRDWGASKCQPPAGKAPQPAHDAAARSTPGLGVVRFI